LTTFLTLLLPFLLSQFFRAFLAVVLGDLVRDLNLGPADLGTMSAAWFWAFAIVQLPLGFALDHAGPRRTLALTMISAVAGAAWLGLAHSRFEAIGAMALIGIGCSPMLMAAYYVLARLYDLRRFAMMSSLLLGFGSLGDPLSATPLALAITAFGWRATMGAIAAITAASAALVWLLLRDPPELAAGPPRLSFLAGIAEVARIHALWRILPLTLVGYGVVIALRGLWIAPFLQDVHGFDAAQRGHAALVMGLAGGFGALAYGPISRWLGGPKPAALGGTLITAAALVGLSLVGDRSPRLAVGLLAVVGFFGITYALIMAHGRSFMPTHLLGRGVTFMNFVFMGGGGLVQSVSGRYVQWASSAGLPPSAIYGRLHLGFALVLAGALAIYSVSRPRPGSLGAAE
jgi:predicted MFS family arabinose efflux permease